MHPNGYPGVELVKLIWPGFVPWEIGIQEGLQIVSLAVCCGLSIYSQVHALETGSPVWGFEEVRPFRDVSIPRVLLS